MTFIFISQRQELWGPYSHCPLYQQVALKKLPLQHLILSSGSSSIFTMTGTNTILLLLALAPHSFRTQTKIGLINPTDTENYFLFCSSLESCDSELSMFIHHTSSEQLAMVTDFLLVLDLSCFT